MKCKHRIASADQAKKLLASRLRFSRDVIELKFVMRCVGWKYDAGERAKDVYEFGQEYLANVKDRNPKEVRWLVKRIASIYLDD